VTVLLTRSLVDRAVGLDPGGAFRVLEDGFRAAAPAPAPLRARTDLPGPGTAMLG
jgi:ornithine cyclodeaminase